MNKEEITKEYILNVKRLKNIINSYSRKQTPPFSIEEYVLIQYEKFCLELIQENKQLKDNWNKLKEYLWNLRNVAFTKEFGNEWNNCLSFNEDILPIINKMQELESGDSDVEYK